MIKMPQILLILMSILISSCVFSQFKGFNEGKPEIIEIDINNIVKGHIYRLSNSYGGELSFGRKVHAHGEIYFNSQLTQSRFSGYHNQIVDIYNFNSHSWSEVTLRHSSRVYADTSNNVRYAHLSGLDLFYKNNNIFLAVGPEFDAYDFFNTENMGVGFTLKIKFKPKK